MRQDFYSSYNFYNNFHSLFTSAYIFNQKQREQQQQQQKSHKMKHH